MDDFEKNIPFELIIPGFVVLLVVTTVLRRKMRDRELIKQGQLPSTGTSIPSIEQRVAKNPAWSRGEIRAGGRAGIVVLWIAAIAWNLTIGIAFIKSFTNPSLQTAHRILLGVFSVGGIAFAVLAVRFTLRRLRFGDSWCQLTNKAGVLGKNISGAVRSQKEVPATGDYTFTVQCLETYIKGSGKNRSTEVRVVWEGKQTVSHQGTNSCRGIPFSIPLPPYPPETGHQLSRGTIRWQLRVTAPVQGVDYAATFGVPVFKVD